MNHPVNQEYHHCHHHCLSHRESRHHHYHSPVGFQLVDLVDYLTVHLAVLVDRFVFVPVVVGCSHFGFDRFGFLALADLVARLARHLDFVGLARYLVADLVVLADLADLADLAVLACPDCWP